MKKLFTTILVAVIMTLLATTSALGETETFIVLTDQDPLLIRDAPYGGVPIGKLPQYTVFEGERYDNYKVQIDINGRPGYVYLGKLMKYSEYLEMLTEDLEDDCADPCVDPNFNPEATPTYVHIYSVNDINSIYTIDNTKVNEFVRVFRQNDMNSEVIGTIGVDEWVYVITLGPTYTKVFYNNRVGFVLTKNLLYYMNLLPEKGELYQIKLNNDTTIRLWSQKTEDSTIMIRLFMAFCMSVSDGNVR